MGLELKHVAGNTYYIPGAVNTGVVVNGKKCLIIDTGLDRQAGKQIWRCLDQAGYTPTIIINTHSHADHCGGNAIIRELSAAKIYASPLEKAVIENTYLEPFYLFSAAPVKDLTTRFLMAPASPVEGVLKEGPFATEDFLVHILSLPGHSPEQIGVVTTDDVCFSADAYFGEAIIEKYGMPYCADVTATLHTLTLLWQSRYSHYVPCHGERTDKPTEEILKNVAIIEKTLEDILQILQEKPLTREEVLAAVMTTNKRELNAVQYVLNHGVITACLSHLHKIHKAEYHFRDGKMLWQQTPERACIPGG